ncbi:Alpha-ketoglutarate-dependent dioxygenase [Nymphaea thermarum]|nr:Alpha-ketoglutarate-dependent dioxygenase [Nymphaea thermarum]
MTYGEEEGEGGNAIVEQHHLVRESLTQFPQPPNRTNHNAIYGPIYNLFDAHKEGKVLAELCSPNTRAIDAGSCLDSIDSNACRWVFVEEGYCTSKGSPHKKFPASMLLRKLRWSTLGLQFDWSKRSYDVSLPHGTIPDMLAEIAKRLARLATPEDEFHPEAAIVNYYGPDDTLGGHVDDMEADWSKPIVSISLGCKAVFLLGGNQRDHPPIAMFVRTGDVVLMAGAARECFHGVPRIFTDEENADVSALAQQFSSADEFYFKNYIQTSRININVRQVF